MIQTINRPRQRALPIGGWFLLLLSGLSCTAQQDLSAVIPRPVSYQSRGGSFLMDKTTRILTSADKNDSHLRFLAGTLRELTGLPLPIVDEPRTGSPQQTATGTLQFDIDTAGGLGPEGYRLVVDPAHILITGQDEAGIFYGLQTLVQLMTNPLKATHSLQTTRSSAHPLQTAPPVRAVYRIGACAVTDYPRFHYRGMHLDVSRHLFPVPVIEKWIDALASFKINTFHWHLTDDQGWRIEIKRYPRLQSISAWRDETLIGHKKELPHRFDGKKYGGYYTQEEVREIVGFAASRHITVIPEIEMPGHAQAVLAAYPDLGCTGGPYKTATYWGVFDDVFCAGNDSVFAFLENVLDEVIGLFPSAYLHIGGDECPKTRWHVCPKCQRRMKELGLPDEHALQSYFIQRIGKYVNGKGRSIIGWDEILEGGLTPGATVMSWQGEEGGLAAARQKHTAIMSTESNLYFDYYQSLYPEEPLAAGGYTPLQKVYGYEPLAGVKDPDILQILQYVTGVQGQLWTEYLATPEQAEYMLFPRAAAMAEVGWRQASDPALSLTAGSHGYRLDYADFLRRFRLRKGLLKRHGIHFADNFDEIVFTSEASPGRTSVVLSSSLPGAEIRYTTGGREPGPKDAAYTVPLVLKKSVVLRARVYYNGRPYGRIFHKEFHLHKAIGALVTIAHPPMPRFNPGPSVLVNGLAGSSRYNDGQWLGFSGTDAEIVVDLGKVQVVRSVGTEVLNYHWQRMWAPVSLEFSVSTDGKEYREVYRQTEFPVNGINPIRCLFPESNARYVKVRAVNKGIIPAGEYGAGGKASLLLDEIIVE
ncbi:MAG: glycoside hydrolase family 20 protein [Puia sp.]|nr:glycoside hydrolase family 20 protein [Puia sp.]